VSATEPGSKVRGPCCWLLLPILLPMWMGEMQIVLIDVGILIHSLSRDLSHFTVELYLSDIS